MSEVKGRHDLLITNLQLYLENPFNFAFITSSGQGTKGCKHNFWNSCKSWYVDKYFILLFLPEQGDGMIDWSFDFSRNSLPLLPKTYLVYGPGLCLLQNSSAPPAFRASSHWPISQTVASHGSSHSSHSHKDTVLLTHNIGSACAGVRNSFPGPPLKASLSESRNSIKETKPMEACLPPDAVKEIESTTQKCGAHNTRGWLYLRGDRK